MTVLTLWAMYFLYLALEGAVRSAGNFMSSGLEGAGVYSWLFLGYFLVVALILQHWLSTSVCDMLWCLQILGVEALSDLRKCVKIQFSA